MAWKPHAREEGLQHWELWCNFLLNFWALKLPCWPQPSGIFRFGCRKYLESTQCTPEYRFSILSTIWFELCLFSSRWVIRTDSWSGRHQPLCWKKYADDWGRINLSSIALWSWDMTPNKIFSSLEFIKSIGAPQRYMAGGKGIDQKTSQSKENEREVSKPRTRS